jgi:hypothetical protein
VLIGGELFVIEATQKETRLLAITEFSGREVMLLQHFMEDFFVSFHGDLSRIVNRIVNQINAPS